MRSNSTHNSLGIPFSIYTRISPTVLRLAGRRRERRALLAGRHRLDYYERFDTFTPKYHKRHPLRVQTPGRWSSGSGCWRRVCGRTVRYRVAWSYATAKCCRAYRARRDRTCVRVGGVQVFTEDNGSVSAREDNMRQVGFTHSAAGCVTLRGHMMALWSPPYVAVAGSQRVDLEKREDGPTVPSNSPNGS
jgi:hypothetical protein